MATREVNTNAALQKREKACSLNSNEAESFSTQVGLWHHDNIYLARYHITLEC